MKLGMQIKADVVAAQIRGLEGGVAHEQIPLSLVRRATSPVVR
jgi:hypothetical protein